MHWTANVYLSYNSLLTIATSFPLSDIGILNEVITNAVTMSKINIKFIADFDHLPKDIRSKLKEGIYSIGESKQVEGNMMPVIFYENGNE